MVQYFLKVHLFPIGPDSLFLKEKSAFFSVDFPSEFLHIKRQIRTDEPFFPVIELINQASTVVKLDA